MDLSRRSLLQVGAGALAAGTAGCLGDFAGQSSSDQGYAAFFTLWDWTERIAGESLTFENPVPTGTMGHGWEPDTGLTADIATTGAFVYLDSPEFGWAQDTAETLQSDYEQIAVIDVLDGIEEELIGWDEDGTHEGSDGDHEEEDHDHSDEGSHEEEGHDHEEEGDHDEDSHDGHDHSGDFDPHVWLDPVLAMDMIDTIADGLADADAENADTFAENAETYKEDLTSLDEQFQASVDEGEHDAVVLASHDSFRYIERRYDIEFHTPSGVSPDEEPSHGDIADTIEFVDDRGIDVILYDVFESPTLAESIVDESNASDMRGLTPLSGTTEEWESEEWGYVEQMEEINLSAFNAALEAPSS